MNELAALALSAARLAAPGLLARFGRAPEGVETKTSATDLVSEADREAEEIIAAELRRGRPQDGLRGEEGGRRGSVSGITWLVDPLDGTTNYLCGLPHWSVSVGAEDAGGPLAGAVVDPLRGEEWSAARGEGARGTGGRALAGPPPRELSLATIGGDLAAADGRAGMLADRFARTTGHVRSFGSVALDLAWVAAGRFDAVVHERAPRDWDIAAGLVICREAGVRVELLPTAARGGSPRLLAAPPALWDELEELVR